MPSESLPWGTAGEDHAAHRLYSSGVSGAGGRVVIVTDVQEGFTRRGNLASPECTAAIPRVVRVVEEELDAGTPVVFTKDSHVENDAEFRMFPPHCIVGTDEHDLVEELRRFEPDAAAVIQKRRYSAFFDTQLEHVLADLAPDEVHVCGFCTDICVLHTVSDLRNRDYDVVVRPEACETFDAPGHEHEEVNRWALSHIESILGARVS
jgi:nicotinamidase/pyrazinamidase